eukprot:3637305-Rhodomonas_salina.2
MSKSVWCAVWGAEEGHAGAGAEAAPAWHAPQNVPPYHTPQHWYAPLRLRHHTPPPTLSPLGRYAVSGTEEAMLLPGHSPQAMSESQVLIRTALRARYAMSGTDAARGTILQPGPGQVHDGTAGAPLWPTRLVRGARRWTLAGTTTTTRLGAALSYSGLRAR